ncbi:MAG TPA: hypothetical protein VF490_19665 [Chryseosolibacter sp.]
MKNIVPVTVPVCFQPRVKAFVNQTITPEEMQYWDKFAIFAICARNLWLTALPFYFSPSHTHCPTSKVGGFAVPDSALFTIKLM